MHSIKEILSASKAVLIEANNLSLKEAKFEVQLILQFVLKVNRAWLIAHENDVDRKSTRLNSSHPRLSRMPSSA